MGQFISYAQNFEDVMLWRALKYIQQGFYVDVGANDPRIDSVTMAFYERGWRGINIEPMQEYYEALCRERPEDVNLPNAVAAAESEILFFEVPQTGLSTMISEAAQTAQQTGRNVVQRTVVALPLNKILNEHAREPIHFLKIDVEGFEAEVINGIDLFRWRPWIIVVEATIPNSSELNYESWEPLLLSAKYDFVYFDGLNRFYVSSEHAELAAAFAVPPNYFDNFFTAYQVRLSEHINRQESVIWDLNEKQKVLAFNKQELDALRPELEWARREIDYLRVEINRTRDERDSLRLKNGELEKQLSSYQALTTELSQVRAELDLKRVEVESLRREYINVLYSFSYRITAPLRVLYVQVYKMRNHIRKILKPSLKEEKLAVSSTEPIVPDPQFVVDKQYYYNFFQREINRRQKKNR